MNLVAINATHMVGRVRAADPVPRLLTLRVATEAHAIRFLWGTLREGYNLGDVSATVDVQAAIAVALLTLDSLLRVESVLEILGDRFMASCAGVRAHGLGARNLQVFREGRYAFRLFRVG
jgi:hypothetical protein